MPYLLDADWAISALAGRRKVLEHLDRIASEGIAISPVTLGEVYEGAFDKPDPARELAVYREFLQQFALLEVTDPIMERFAAVRSDLRRRGQLIPDLDLITAATALHHDLTLLTSDTHFRRVPGLKLYDSGKEG